MTGIFEYRLVVRDTEIDAFHHANNLSYLRWFVDAAGAHSEAVGWPTQRYREAGFAWVVRSHHIDYLKPALQGEGLVCQTWVATMDAASSLRRYRLLRFGDKALLARAETLWVLIDLARGLPKRVPPELAGAFIVVAEEA